MTPGLAFGADEIADTADGACLSNVVLWCLRRAFSDGGGVGGETPIHAA